MTKKITFLVLTVSLLAFGCAPKTASDNSHAGMNHNTMPMNNNAMDQSSMDHSTMQSSANAATAPYDLQFLDTMSAHHQAAVEMAAPCAAKALHVEIKTLCANIISSQQKEIADMKAWRDKWFAGERSTSKIYKRRDQITRERHYQGTRDRDKTDEGMAGGLEQIAADLVKIIMEN